MTILDRSLSRARRVLNALTSRQDGIAAVEFALVLPLLVAMLLGMTELTLGIGTDRKLTLVARSIADLTSRATDVLSTTDVGDTFSASTIIMQPYSSSAIKMTMSSLKVTYSAASKTYTGSVDWSCASGLGATTKPITTTYAVPTGFQTDGSHYILAETVLPYTPLFGYTFTGVINLTENTPWPVRNVSKVKLPSSCLAGCVCPDPA